MKTSGMLATKPALDPDAAQIATATASSDAPVTIKVQRAHAALPSLHAIIAAILSISLGVGFWLLMSKRGVRGNSEIVLAMALGCWGI